jgi:Spy/CpxP family protein refolding chaperone
MSLAMEHENKPSLLRRREILKLGAVATAAIPAILTLAPQHARAEGSWNKHSKAHKMDWRQDTRETFEMKGQIHQDPNQGFVFPGSYEWREQRRQEEERRRQMRGEFNRFGSGEG